MPPFHASLLPVLLLLCGVLLLLLHAVHWPTPASHLHHAPCLLHPRGCHELHPTHLGDRHVDSNILVHGDRHGHGHGLHNSALRWRGGSKANCCCCTLLALHPVLVLLLLLQLLLCFGSGCLLQCSLLIGL
jgi:hypothetical protein